MPDDERPVLAIAARERARSLADRAKRVWQNRIFDFDDFAISGKIDLRESIFCKSARNRIGDLVAAEWLNRAKK